MTKFHFKRQLTSCSESANLVASNTWIDPLRSPTIKLLLHPEDCRSAYETPWEDAEEIFISLHVTAHLCLQYGSSNNVFSLNCNVPSSSWSFQNEMIPFGPQAATNVSFPVLFDELTLRMKMLNTFPSNACNASILLSSEKKYNSKGIIQIWINTHRWS